MRIAGTIPEELWQWAKAKIKSRQFYGESHLLEVAIRRLKEDEDGHTLTNPGERRRKRESIGEEGRESS